MQGVVEKVMRVGVIAVLDWTPEVGDQVEICRVVDGVTTVLGTGYVRKAMGVRWKVNPPDTDDGDRGVQFPDVQVGDLVRSV
jgi:hypothetical protein